MARQTHKALYVYADWEGLHGPVLMGVIHSTLLRGKEVFSFTYDKQWLADRLQIQLDPNLFLYQGPQYVNDPKSSLFGIFTDSAPDRWGRVLMQRREALQASQERRELRALHESDYLLGVQDFSRMGALRFAAAIGGPFLADDELYMCPPIAGLRDLEWMTMKFEEKYDESSHEYREWLNQIIAPGSSLGGARPKSGVLDVDGSLWIAKFPSNRDTYDVGGWEMVVHELASRVGIQVPSAKIQRFSSRYHTFLSKRFDRTDTQMRVHFASAMTLLGYTDGAGAQEGVSYLELASLIHRSGSRPDRDLKELWKRIVFSICVSNSDDHLRNHGFLLDEDGWRLSPAYDINPVPHAQSLSLNVNEYDNSMRLSLAVEVAPYFRLTEAEAKREIETMKEIISSWKMIASSYGIPVSEQRMMSPAFDRI